MYNQNADFFDENETLPDPDSIETLKRLYSNKYPYLEIVSTDIYGNPEEVIMNPYPWLEPCFEVPGFWYIPGTNYNYAINEYGVIYSFIQNRELEPRKNKRGYRAVVFGYINDKFVKVARHRLVAACFIPDQRSFSELQVNHIDCVPGNDHASNLEWLTQKENIRHFYESKKERSWIPIEARNVYTGEIKYFANRIIAAEFFGRTTKDWIEYVISQPETRIWEGKWQIRTHDQYNRPFPDLNQDQINQALLHNGLNNKTYLRNALTKEIIEFESQSECSSYLNLSQGALSTYINDNRQPTFLWNNVIWQVKNNPYIPWRDFLDPYLDLEQCSLNQPVKVIYPDGRFEIYFNAAECAKAHGLLKTTLNERLKVNNPNKFWKDGKAYVRYINYPGY